MNTLLVLNGYLRTQARNLRERDFQQVQVRIKTFRSRFHLGFCQLSMLVSSTGDTHSAYRIARGNKLVMVIVHQRLSLAVELAYFCRERSRYAEYPLEGALDIPDISSFSFFSNVASVDVVMSCS